VSKLVVPEPAICLMDHTARSMGLSARDIVHPYDQHKYVMLDTKKDLLDLRAVQEAMRGKQGLRPVISIGPDQQTPTILIVDDKVDAHEVQDTLGQKFEQNEDRLKKDGQEIDYGWVRRLNGMPQADQFDGLFRQAIHDRIKKHKANPISDPGRDPFKEAGMTHESGYISNPALAYKGESE
jgi:hypothetical protein